MDIPTIPGAWYTVASSTTCQITDTATGTPLGTADAGSYTFQAQGNLTTLSDDSALYSKSNFKSAPAALMALGLLGGGTSTPSLPAGYLAAEFLASSSNGPYIDPQYVPTRDFGFETQITELYPQAYYYFTPVMGCRNSNSTGTSCSFGFRYGGGQISLGWNGSFYDVAYEICNKQVVSCNFLNNRKMYMGETLVREVPSLSFDPICNFMIFKYVVSTNTTFAANTAIRLYYVKMSDGETVVRDYVAALDPQGMPCMFDKVTNQPFYNSGTGAFVVGMSSKQAHKLSTLPATGGSLTISLPEGYASDPAVTDAIATATANGWNFTIQTYTPAAAASSSSFSLRRIWVRQTPDEFGSYVDASGNRFAVDWCVAMSHTDGSTPDAHGYELFRSVDAAVGYWGLTPYVDPETEKLLTENTNNV